MGILASGKNSYWTLALFYCQHWLGGIHFREYWGAITLFFQ